MKRFSLILCLLAVPAGAQMMEGTGSHMRRNNLLEEVPGELNQGASDKAIGALEEADAIGLTHKQKRLWLPVLADLYVRENRYDKALPVLHEALENDRKNWQRHLALGLACYDVGLNDEAIVVLEKTIKLKPDTAEALLLLGRLYAKKGFLDEAERRLEEYVALEPNSPEGRLSLAEVFEKGGRFQKAVEQLEHAAAIQADPRIYFKMGLLYAYQSQMQASLDAYRRGQTLEPKNNGDYDFYAGLTYWLKKDWPKTERFMTLAIEKGRPGGLAYFFRSLAYYHQGSMAAAREDAARARALAQGDFLAKLSDEIIHGTRTAVD